MIFDSDPKKLEAFKIKHSKEGQFTDEDGVIVLATGFYLGVTLRIISRSNSRNQPFTEYNENQQIIFNIFLDDRHINSQHFQALKPIKMGSVQSNDEVVNAYKEKRDNEGIEAKIKENRKSNWMLTSDLHVQEIQAKNNGTRHLKRKHQLIMLPKEMK